MPEIKVLFILKYRESSGGGSCYGTGLSSGLANSANFMNDMLNRAGIESRIEHAIDNNCIDKLVTFHKPTHVIIEAYWVVPEKFAVLTKLHPHIKWIIRNHSEIPFLASEGIAIDWTCKYVQYKNVYISANAPRAYHDLLHILIPANPTWTIEEVKEKIVFLPNAYTFKKMPIVHKPHSEYINVACFGAIRPLKNQLLQAIAALQFAEKINKKLRFHINSDRIESGATNQSLKNLRNLFLHDSASGHELVEHAWMDHDTFLNVLNTEIDVASCVSQSETFCIIAADAVNCNVPLVASREVPWASWFVRADPGSSRDIARRMYASWKSGPTGLYHRLNMYKLIKFCQHSKHQWLTVLRELR